MAIKYFKKIYADRVAAGKWKPGDAINYNPGPDYTVEDITLSQYNTIKANVKTYYEDKGKDFEIMFNKLDKAFALVVLDEINILRVEAGLSERTVAQLKTAIENKYDTL